MLVLDFDILIMMTIDAELFLTLQQIYHHYSNLSKRKILRLDTCDMLLINKTFIFSLYYRNGKEYEISFLEIHALALCSYDEIIWQAISRQLFWLENE